MIRYYRWNTVAGPRLMRETPDSEQIYVDGSWRDTNAIFATKFGHLDDVDDITDAEARALEPAAFSVAA